jgi:DNA-directed RNA polymerase subunit omega
MSWRQDTMISPPIEGLLDRVDSKFSLVTLAARRARQVNSYFNQLGEGLGALVPPQVASTARKPLSIAFEEIAADKITFERIDEAALVAAVAAAAAGSPAAPGPGGEPSE